MTLIENMTLLIGRLLLGLYFIVPGLTKITNYAGMTEYMSAHEVPFISILLPVTIALQLGCGIALIIGYKGKLVAFVLAGLTLVISIYMHNFWSYEVGTERSHEMQNFIKNMAIMGGLLMVSAIGTGRFSLTKSTSSPPWK